ncbi:hypothetical protein LMG30237_ALEAABJJ_01458 [Fructobacillus tropaeoli]|nr:hypothetical protein LMG30237_ALEAABJJ_01458 [Fructobacillus tropaeoli]
MVQAEFERYMALTNMNYREAISYLKNRYGEVTDNYFREKSYERFLNQEIKSIAKGKYSKTAEGLYTHHILENKFANISNLNFIRKYQYPFYLQTKENLVYADLVEHLILHGLITKETNGEFGYAGYQFIYPMLVTWLIWGIDPKPAWMKNVKNKINLTSDEATKIYRSLNEKFIKGLKTSVIAKIMDSFFISQNIFQYEIEHRFRATKIVEKIENMDKYEKKRYLKRINYYPGKNLDEYDDYDSIEYFFHGLIAPSFRYKNFVWHRIKPELYDIFRNERLWEDKSPEHHKLIHEIIDKINALYRKIEMDGITDEATIVDLVEKAWKPYWVSESEFKKNEEIYWNAFDKAVRLYRKYNHDYTNAEYKTDELLELLAQHSFDIKLFVAIPFIGDYQKEFEKMCSKFSYEALRTELNRILNHREQVINDNINEQLKFQRESGY